MADPNLTKDELGLLDFFISEAQTAGANAELEAVARGVCDVLTTIPLRMAGDTYDYKISDKVRKALADALATPGISLAELMRIRKIIRTL